MSLRCPKCQSKQVDRVRRNATERLFRRHKAKYRCDECQSIFFARPPIIRGIEEDSKDAFSESELKNLETGWFEKIK